MKTNTNKGEQLPAVEAPQQQMSLMERMKEIESQTVKTEGLSEEECEALRALVKKSKVTKVCLAVKLGIKVNTLAYKLKFGTLSKIEAEKVLNEIIEALKSGK